MENFLEVDFTISPVETGRDILLALLADIGYDSFEETDEGLKAYILNDDFDESAVKALFVFESEEFTISYKTDKLAVKNWNEEWETNYEPIIIDDKIYVRAPFHEANPKYPLEVLITPKMSFGTGHHQTTRLVSQLMLPLPWEGKTVLDMGTGTGMLAILAEKLGAEKITAIDNFEWAVENTDENALANNCTRISTIHGDAKALKGLKFDFVLANINRNVLLHDMEVYLGTLATGGELIISGFFDRDEEKLVTEAAKWGAQLIGKTTEDKWMACHFIKS